MARPRSTIERIQTGFRMRPDIIRNLKHLSIDLNKPLNILLEEAAEDLMRKYENASIRNTAKEDPADK